MRCGCSSPSCTVVFCAADIDGPLHTACTALSTCTPSCRSALQCDHFHKSTSECQRSYSTSSPVSTGMGDRLQAGKPPRNVNAGRLVSGQVHRGKRKASVLCLSVCLSACLFHVCLSRIEAATAVPRPRPRWAYVSVKCSETSETTHWRRKCDYEKYRNFRTLVLIRLAITGHADDRGVHWTSALDLGRCRNKYDRG